MKTLNWAILGTGTIANEMAASMQKHGRPAYAVGNRTYEKAKAFGQKYGIQKVYADFQEMFIDPEVDIIYILMNPLKLESISSIMMRLEEHLI